MTELRIGRRPFLSQAGAFAGALALAGCGKSENKSAGTPVAGATPQEQALIPAAQKEGKLVLYTGSEESIAVNLGKAFQARYGISLEYQRLNSIEIAQRYTAEAQAGHIVADVMFTGDHEMFQNFQKKGWLAKLDAAKVPGLSAWPADYRDDYAPVVSVVPYTIAINTQKIKAPPKDWNFLLDPALKGSIVTLDVRRVNLVAIAAWDFLLHQYGEDFLKKIGQQQLRLVDSAPSAVQQLASGAASVYVPASRTQAESMIAQGAPVQAVVPEGAPYTGVLSQVGMSASAPHPNAAALFLGFLFSEGGQKILNVVASSPVSSPGAPPLRKGFVKPDFVSTAANKDKIATLLGM
jgi:iron(III) transport system substrate-binding protein